MNEDNIVSHRKFNRHEWVKILDEKNADPMFIIGYDDEQQPVVLHNLASAYEAAGFLTEIINIVLYGEIDT